VLQLGIGSYRYHSRYAEKMGEIPAYHTVGTCPNHRLPDTDELTSLNVWQLKFFCVYIGYMGVVLVSLTVDTVEIACITF